MQYVLTKSIEYYGPKGYVLIPAGVVITVDLSEMVGFFADEHFDVESTEISAIQ